MNPKVSKIYSHMLMSSPVHILITLVVLAIALISMNGSRALAEKAKSTSKLSDYLLSASGFNQMSLEDQVRYSMFVAQFGYSLETIQGAPQDQLVRAPNQTKRESAYYRSEGSQSESWWFALLFGEEVFGSEPVSPIESACQPGSNAIGSSCLIGGHLSVFYEETKNGMKSQKCRVPVEGTQCGERQFSCSSFGLSGLFQVVDKYNKGNKSTSICVPGEPPNQLTVRCGQAFTAWRKNQFKKLSTTDYRVESSTGLITVSQKADLYENYSRLLAHFEKTVYCAQDKVERCQALNKIRRGTFGNGVQWEYDAKTNTSIATIPGAKGYASFSGRPKGGAFTGELVDPDFQRSECANVLAAAVDINNSWEAVPSSIKLWAKQFRQNSEKAYPVKNGVPSQRDARGSI
ncbi:MAG: hypothetical protein IPK68_21680 [Bdellovibrionales bacterium]|nr:hypothetical protein [Bdellovibrionales bacterium]